MLRGGGVVREVQQNTELFSTFFPEAVHYSNPTVSSRSILYVEIFQFWERYFILCGRSLEVLLMRVRGRAWLTYFYYCNQPSDVATS